MNNAQAALAAYHERNKSRAGLPPRPLDEKEVRAFIEALADANCPLAERDEIIRLLDNEVRGGSYPEAKLKAEALYDFAVGEKNGALTPPEALSMLVNMNGGAADLLLVKCLEESSIDRDIVAAACEKIFTISKEALDYCAALAAGGNEYMRRVLEQWAHRSWEAHLPFPETITVIALKTGDYISTDHLSPSKRASSRTDRPLHATFLMEGRDDQKDFAARWKKLAAQGRLAVVGGLQFGEGSSRKSATYNLLEVIGMQEHHVPESKRGGVLIAKSIAPIFENSVISSGVIPLKADTDLIAEGDVLRVELSKNIIVNETQKKDIPFAPLSPFVLKKLRAGGLNAYMSQKKLYLMAAEAAKRLHMSFEAPAVVPAAAPKPQSIMRKLFTANRLDGASFTETGENVEVKIRGVFSQDTTGPMTMDEYRQIGGGTSFQSEFVVQSVCHTSECPTTEERNTQLFLQRFVREHGGVALEAGEGIIHTIANRFVLPTDIIVGGDSHTRTERGVSFPAGSDIVAIAMKYGFLELSVDEEVLVTFTGKLNEGVTVRDAVSMLVTEAERTGLGKGIYNGRVIEFGGVEHFNRDERYILTNAVAERSSSAGVMPTDSVTVASVTKDLVYLKHRYDRGDRSQALIKTITSFEAYLTKKTLFASDPGTVYAAKVSIDLSRYKEPLIAKPHHPDNVATLSDVAGTKVDEVFIGSCVGGDLASIRAAAFIMEGKRIAPGVQCVVIPASADIHSTLMKDGTLAKLHDAGAIIGIPSCGLCMGNKRRIGDNATAVTTTTRNYQSRIGPSSAQAFLASAEVAALCALEGKFISAEAYHSAYHARVAKHRSAITAGI
ncbi:MAG: aconitase [Spirochaetes bacterium]|nr:aconitase [Spirochaetota bacterium]